MRKPSIYLLLLGLLAAQPALAQSFSGFLRGLSNSLSGGGSQPAPVQGNSATATLGVRGMDDGSAATAGPARTEDIKLLDGWSATKVEAEIAAKKRGLHANKAVSYGDNPAPATAPSEEPAP